MFLKFFSHFFVLIYIKMHVFRKYFVTLGADSVHDVQKTSLVMLVSD